MAFKSAAEWVQHKNDEIEKDTAERKARADAECEKIKARYGYDGLSDEQKKDFDEKLQYVRDDIMGEHRSEAKKDSTEEDPHDEREIER